MSQAPVVSSPVTSEEAHAWLAQDPVAHVELLTAFIYGADVQSVGAFRVSDGPVASTHHMPMPPEPYAAASPLVGVLVAAREGLDSGPTVRMATDDVTALDVLLTALPQGSSRIVVQRAWMLPIIAAGLRLAPEGDPETVFALSALPPIPAAGVRALTIADAPMMAASATLWGRTGLVDAVRAGFRPFGVVRGERVIACAMAANVTAWTEEVMSVWTARRYRKQGLASAVVAVTAADIIGRGKIAIYVAARTNHASQRVAEKVGFQRAYDVATYRIRR